MDGMDRILVFSEIYEDDDTEKLKKCAPNWNEFLTLGYF
jgi:hypothetical protein